MSLKDQLRKVVADRYTIKQDKLGGHRAEYRHLIEICIAKVKTQIFCSTVIWQTDEGYRK